MTPPSPTTPQDLEVRVALRNAVDPRYIEQRVGPAFYTHLRGAERIVEFRLRAIGRAHTHYQAAIADDAPEPQVAGFGLLVFQRSFLLVEDLGGLMYAVTGPDPWARLTGYRAVDLDELFGAVLEQRQDLGTLWLLPTDEQVEGSPRLDEEGRAAARKLRDITLDEARPLFDFAASFWMAHREATKTTMHGFGVVAAEYLLAAPGGGELTDIVPMDGPRPFALALVSRDDPVQKRVETTHHRLDLTTENIEMVRNTGHAAGKLYLLLARAHRDALRHAHPWMLPNAYQDKLDPHERDALERAAAH